MYRFGDMSAPPTTSQTYCREASLRPNSVPRWPRWPASNFSIISEVPEMKHVACLIATIVHDDEFFARYSSIRKLRRIVAYSLRFRATQRHTGPPTVKELREANTRILIIAQARTFHTHSKPKIGRIARKELATSPPSVPRRTRNPTGRRQTTEFDSTILPETSDSTTEGPSDRPHHSRRTRAESPRRHNGHVLCR